jgi:hypothetical protein
MHRFTLGPKAVQEIKKFQVVLNRFPWKERKSIVGYLAQDVNQKNASTGTTATRNVRRRVTQGKRLGDGQLPTTRQRKLSRIASSRKRTASGTFAPIKSRLSSRTRARAA